MFLEKTDGCANLSGFDRGGVQFNPGLKYSQRRPTDSCRIGAIVVGQQPVKVPRIGILAGASESSTPPFEPFRLGSRGSS